MLPGGQPNLAELRRVISDKRLDAYRTSPGDQDLDLLARYLWNMALCEALYPVIQSLEVAFRNSLHAALTSAFGGAWYDDPTVLVVQRGRDEVAGAKQRLSTQGKAQEADRMVAELPFGFWTSLLNLAYAQSAVRRPPTHKPLWPALVAAAFPYFTPVGGPLAGRPALSKRFNSIRHNLRNRVFHHEPIWRGWRDRSSGVRVPLATQHTDALEAIGWISPALQQTVVRLDRFPAVHAEGEAPFRQVLSVFT
jgi:hypothetical protein